MKSPKDFTCSPSVSIRATSTPSTDVPLIKPSARRVAISGRSEMPTHALDERTILRRVELARGRPVIADPGRLATLLVGFIAISRQDVRVQRRLGVAQGLVVDAIGVGRRQHRVA